MRWWPNSLLKKHRTLIHNVGCGWNKRSENPALNVSACMFVHIQTWMLICILFVQGRQKKWGETRRSGHESWHWLFLQLCTAPAHLNADTVPADGSTRWERLAFLQSEKSHLNLNESMHKTLRNPTKPIVPAYHDSSLHSQKKPKRCKSPAVIPFSTLWPE